MPFIRLPLGVRVAMEYEAFGKVVVNVYHVTTPDPITTFKLFDIADVFDDWWRIDMASIFGVDIGLNAITAQNLDVPNGEKITLPVSPPVTGTHPEPGVSNNVALVVGFRTAQTGRSFRGRAYHAGLTEAMVEANNVEVTKAANIITGYVALDVRLDADNDALVVASFYSAGAPRAEGIGTPIDSFVVNTRVDTQRRRLPRD